MTEQMKKTLFRATGQIGVAGSSLTFEAMKAGWLVSAGTPQNSTTTRYKITEAGRAALEDAA